MDDLNNLLQTAGAQTIKQTLQLIEADGELKNELQYKTANGVLTVSGSKGVHAALYGRPPGQMPPRRPIERWIEENNIITEVSRQSLAYLIQRKIALEGTPGALGSSKLAPVIKPVVMPALKTGGNKFFRKNIIKQMRNAFKNK